MKTIDEFGVVRYHNSIRELRRLDGPAIEYDNGDKFRCQNGKYHRLDGPAIERAGGTKEWWQNDQLHRLDGPAIEYSDGIREWYQDGIYIKTCYAKILIIEEKKIFICCLECAKLQGISEEKLYKLKLLI